MTWNDNKSEGIVRSVPYCGEFITKRIRMGLREWKRRSSKAPSKFSMHPHNEMRVKEFFAPNDGGNLLRFMGAEVQISDNVPDDEVWIFVDDKAVAKICLRPTLQEIK